MSFKRSLSDILKDRNRTLYDRLNRLEGKAEAVLTYTAAAFPYYTPHNFRHSKNVEDNLNWLISDEVKPRLDAWEIFFLIAAAWLHDWGMVCEQGEKPEDVRASHHVRTESNLEKMHNLVELDPVEARIVGRIARGHRKEDIRGPLFDDQIFPSNVHVRIRFLAAILRVADECDITYNRVPELIYYSLNPQGSSEEHFAKHLSIGGIGKIGEHKIFFNAVARDPKGAATLRSLREKIQNQVDGVKGILAQQDLPIEYVEANIDARGFVDKPIAFKLDETSVTQLLIGEALYSRKDAAVRELLQNSIDACKHRRSLNPKEYVAVRIYRDADELVIEDNGKGMDYETAVSFLAKKGLSYYRSEEFKKLQNQMDFDPISRWGLGFLSCFLIASKVVIETQREGAEPCKFIISNVGEGWRYEQTSRRTPGTTVTLTLNEEGSRLVLEKVIRHYVKSTSVPIYLGSDSSQPLKFDWTDDDEDVKSYIQRYTDRFHLGGFTLLLPPKGARGAEDYEDDEVWIRRYKTDMIVPSVLFIANQGFLVERFGPHEEGLPIPNKEIVLVNVKKEVVDLDVSRERIHTEGPKFQAFREKWLKIWFSFLERDFRNETSGPNSPELAKPYAFFKLLEHYNLEPDDLVPRWDLTLLHLLPKTYFDSLARMPVTVLTDEGLSVATLEKISSLQPETVVCYAVMQPVRNTAFLAKANDFFAFEYDFVESQVRAKLPKAQIVVFTFTQPYEDTERRRQINEHVLSRCLSRDIKFDHIWLEDLIFQIRLEKIETPLDELLPRGLSFASLPDSFGRAIVCTSPFVLEFSDSPKSIRPVPDIVVRDISGLPPLGSPEFRIKEYGRLWLDVSDEFVAFLLRNHQRIKSNSALQYAVRDYFAMMACNFLSPSEMTENVIELRERELLALMGQTQPFRPARDRRGGMCLVLLTRQDELLIWNNRTWRFLNQEGKETIPLVGWAEV